MVLRKHQLLTEDESDWIFKTSATCFVGQSKTTTKILQDLFKEHYDNMTKKTLNSKAQNGETFPIKSTSPESKINTPENVSKPTEDVNNSSSGDQRLVPNRKITCNYTLDNFDESQHLNGCPMKWLYNQKLLEKNATNKVTRWCSKKFEKKEVNSRRKGIKNAKNQPPVEVKIHKINLTEKYTNHDDYFPLFKCKAMEKSNTDRHKTGDKLNSKVPEEPQPETEATPSEFCSRTNYLQPRPLLGLKPLLSILLSPDLDISCRSITSHSQRNLAKENMESPSLSIKSLDLPFFVPERLPKPKKPHKRGLKTLKLQKKLQIPNQITINLRQQKQINSVMKPEEALKIIYPQTKKVQEKAKHSPSLSSLIYELSDKTNYKNFNNEFFERILRDISLEEEEFNIKRFLRCNYTPKNLDQGKTCKRQKKKNKSSGGKSEKSVDETSLNLVCGRVRFFQKCPPDKKMKMKKFTK